MQIFLNTSRIGESEFWKVFKSTFLSLCAIACNLSRVFGDGEHFYPLQLRLKVGYVSEVFTGVGASYGRYGTMKYDEYEMV